MRAFIGKCLNRFDNWKEDIKFYSLKKQNRELYNLISLNRRFKEAYKGNRCFVIGNGPSINKQNLALLENEYVFTVNQITRLHSFEKIKTNFHFLADPAFWNLDLECEEDREVLENIEKLNIGEHMPICFFPAEAFSFVKKTDLDKKLNISYFYTHSYFYDDYNKEFDYAFNAPAFQTVVQWAVGMAVYMGFSEIYLLGCDTTVIVGTIQSYLEKDNAAYAYELTENERKRLKKMTSVYDMENAFIGWGRVLHVYKELYKYCGKRNIKLINLSGETIIDSIPRMRYEAVIKENKEHE